MGEVEAEDFGAAGAEDVNFDRLASLLDFVQGGEDGCFEQGKVALACDRNVAKSQPYQCLGASTVAVFVPALDNAY